MQTSARLNKIDDRMVSHMIRSVSIQLSIWENLSKPRRVVDSPSFLLFISMVAGWLVYRSDIGMQNIVLIFGFWVKWEWNVGDEGPM